MVNPVLNEQDFRVLASWNVNHIRWPLVWGGFPHGPADNATMPEYEAWLETVLEHLDSLLPLFRQFGIKILLDMHTPPGGRDQKNHGLYFITKHFKTPFLQYGKRWQIDTRMKRRLWVSILLMNQTIKI